MEIKKQIRKINLRIRLLVDAIIQQQERGEISPFLMKDLEHIFMEELLNDEIKELETKK